MNAFKTVNDLQVPVVWSTEGPVEDEAVEPDFRVQSNWSVLSWVQVQRLVLKLQLMPTFAAKMFFNAYIYLIVQLSLFNPQKRCRSKRKAAHLLIVFKFTLYLVFLLFNLQHQLHIICMATLEWHYFVNTSTYQKTVSITPQQAKQDLETKSGYSQQKWNLWPSMT